MGRRLRTAAASGLAMLLGWAAWADAGERVRHSGTIASIADDARTFVLAEVGPWRVRDGETVITHRTIALTPDTAYAVAARADRAPSGFAGDFVETAVGPERVYLNDHVTVEGRREGATVVALKITVTRLPAPGTGEAR